MADEENGGGGGDAPVKCPECAPGLPAWMATFSDLVTLLLTFFVLLLSFAKTETAKYEAALGSIRNAFGGNVRVMGNVIQPGKSPDDQPTMMETAEPIRPFPIEFLTTEGFLDKHEMNRNSDEDLKLMRSDLAAYDLNGLVTLYESPEGAYMRLKDKIYFKEGSTEIDSISREAFKKMINLLKSEDWVVFVEGNASLGEVMNGSSNNDAYSLSSARATAVTRYLISQGVSPDRISTVFYGDSRPDIQQGNVNRQNQSLNRRVEFMIRKRDLRSEGRKVQ